MNRRTLYILSLILSGATGFLLSLYGVVVGIVGVGPDGPAPVQWRIVGCIALMFGILDLLPKRWIRRKRPFMVAYCILNALPLVVLGAFVAQYLVENGPRQFLANGGLATCLALTAILVLGLLPVFLDQD